MEVWPSYCCLVVIFLSLLYFISLLQYIRLLSPPLKLHCTTHSLKTPCARLHGNIYFFVLETRRQNNLCHKILHKSLRCCILLWVGVTLGNVRCAPSPTRGSEDLLEWTKVGRGHRKYLREMESRGVSVRLLHTLGGSICRATGIHRCLASYSFFSVKLPFLPLTLCPLSGTLSISSNQRPYFGQILSPIYFLINSFFTIKMQISIYERSVFLPWASLMGDDKTSVEDVKQAE